MSDVTRILSQIEAGDPQAAEELLPLVYEELRKLAAARLGQERPGQTFQATPRFMRHCFGLWMSIEIISGTVGRIFSVRRQSLL
jgi:ECF sigma factor